MTTLEVKTKRPHLPDALEAVLVVDVALDADLLFRGDVEPARGADLGVPLAGAQRTTGGTPLHTASLKT